MTLDRTWFNNLVDDNGASIVGTVWNKAQINGLLNTIDTDPGTHPVRTAWTPAMSNAESAAIIVPGTSTLDCSYSVIGKMVFLQIYAINLSNPTPSASMYVQLPPAYPQGPSLSCSAVFRINRGGVNDWGMCHVDVQGYLRVFPGAVAQWPAGTTWFIGQVFYYIN